MEGFELRDLFAAHALNGITSRYPPGDPSVITHTAGLCYEYADAMLAARKPAEPAPEEKAERKRGKKAADEKTDE